MNGTIRRPLSCLVVAAALLGACAPIVRSKGHVLDEDAIGSIEVGAATQDDVYVALGSPSSVNAFGDTTWYYVSARTERTAFFQDELKDQQVVAIVFDDAGTVAAIDRYGLEDGWKLALVERETPTYGKSLGVLQQLIGNVGRFTTDEGTGTRRRPGS